MRCSSEECDAAPAEIIDFAHENYLRLPLRPFSVGMPPPSLCKLNISAIGCSDTGTLAHGLLPMAVEE